MLDFECVEDGSVYGNQYDPIHGNCSCKPGWFGTKCQGKLSFNTSSLKLIRKFKLRGWFQSYFLSNLTDYECYSEGSLYGYEHDQTSRTCACKPGWYSEICNRGKLETRKIKVAWHIFSLQWWHLDLKNFF